MDAPVCTGEHVQGVTSANLKQCAAVWTDPGVT